MHRPNRQFKQSNNSFGRAGAGRDGRVLAALVLLALSLVISLHAQEAASDTPAASEAQVAAGEDASRAAGTGQPPEYILGPEDKIRIWVLGLEEISERPVEIDPAGFVDLPVTGRLRLGGMSIESAKRTLVEHLRAEMHDPQVSLDIVEYGSQPVSVIGAVNSPGVVQLRGRKTLLEALSLAGGLRPDAGHAVKVTRPIESGPLGLPSEERDPSGRFAVAEVKLKGLMAAASPAENIIIRPHDVISVPTAEMIYVMGAVQKPGAFVLNDRETVSVLQALSMAEGLGPYSTPHEARILRAVEGNTDREEIAVDLKEVISGKNRDVSLRANDILFVPTSGSKKVLGRMGEAAVQTVSGLLIWR